MKQSNLFYCHAVFFVSAYALHTVLRVPSGLRLEGVFVCPKKFREAGTIPNSRIVLHTGKKNQSFFIQRVYKRGGVFVYGEGYPILQKKLNTFFDNTGVFRQVFVLRR